MDVVVVTAVIGALGAIVAAVIGFAAQRSTRPLPTYSEDAARRGPNVSRSSIGRDLSVDQSVTTILHASERFGLEDDVRFSKAAYAELQRYEAEIKLKERQLQGAEEHERNLRDSVLKRTRSTTISVAALALGIGVLAGLLVGLAARGTEVPATSTSPTASGQSALATPLPSKVASVPVVATAEAPTERATADAKVPTPSLDRIKRASGVIEEYFSRAGRGDAPAMRELISAKFLEKSGKEKGFDLWWGRTVTGVEAVVSPGRPPIVDPYLAQDLWVQVAWRETTKASDDDLSATPWRLQWFRMIQTFDTPLLDEVQSGTPKKCQPDELSSCSAIDAFTP